MSKIVRKFKFSDLRLAFKVRDHMFNALIAFDQNGNHLFQASEIRNALVSILGEDETEVQYVVNNVFRYDTDGDNAVTYAELTNFFVEQHFGEMAIQRLHRKQFYLNGDKRIMSLQQFQTTLNYCLQFINSKGSHLDYERLFKQVDLDRDEMITYQEYFMFLREYFGSQSQAFEEQEKNPRPIPVKPRIQIKVQPSPAYIDLYYSSAQQRFAKLIYSQFRISVLDRDRNKNMILQKPQVEDIISNSLRLQSNELSQLRDKCLNGSNNIKYDDFLRNALVNYMSDTSIHKINNQTINQNQFVNIVSRVCHFVSIKPSDSVLIACFKEVSRGNGHISIIQYRNIMRSIFQKYTFDLRGLPNTKIIRATATTGIYY